VKTLCQIIVKKILISKYHCLIGYFLVAELKFIISVEASYDTSFILVEAEV